MSRPIQAIVSAAHCRFCNRGSALPASRAARVKGGIGARQHGATRYNDYGVRVGNSRVSTDGAAERSIPARKSRQTGCRSALRGPGHAAFIDGGQATDANDGTVEGSKRSGDELLIHHGITGGAQSGSMGIASAAPRLEHVRRDVDMQSKHR
jgi:hypothetical protein